MTTKEKQRRKNAAKRHRIETPAVIVPPVNEGNDLLEAANMKLKPENTSDQVADDPTINTESADDFIEEVTRDDVPPVGEERSPTNTELATAALEAFKASELEPDPLEVWFSEKCIALKNWLSTAPGKAHDALIAGWMKLDNAFYDGAGAILNWADRTNQTFSQQWAKWFPAKVTRDELFEVVNRLGEMIVHSHSDMVEKLMTKNTVDRGRLDSLLAAVQANQKVRATKLYASLTGADLGTAKEAIEALA